MQSPPAPFLAFSILEFSLLRCCNVSCCVCAAVSLACIKAGHAYASDNTSFAYILAAHLVLLTYGTEVLRRPQLSGDNAL